MIFKRYKVFKIFFIFTLFFFNANSQTDDLRFIIFDNNTKTIPYSSIYLNHNLVVISNELGEFEIKGLKLNPIDSLVIKSIGYRTTTVPIFSGSHSIVLIEEDIMLKEVVVTAQNFTTSVLADCLKNGFDTLATEKQTVLCRQYGKRDGDLKRFSEGIFNCIIDLANVDMVKLDLIDSRALDDHMNDGHKFNRIRYGINLRNEIKRTFDSFKKTLVNKSYNYSLFGRINVEGVECYKISFSISPKNDIPKEIKNLITNGTIYITVNGHKIKKIERNLLSRDFKRKWFTSETYKTNIGKSLIESLKITSELIGSKLGDNLPPLGGMDIYFKSDNKIVVSDQFSYERKSQDLYNSLREYDKLRWIRHYGEFDIKLPTDVFEAFSNFRDIDTQFSDNGKK